MRKTIFLIVPLLWVLCIGVCAQNVEQHLTIEQMFQLAEQNNTRIKAHTTAAEQAQQEVKVAKSSYLPSVEASLSFSYNGDGTILDRDFSNTFSAPIPDFGNNFVIEVSQVICRRCNKQCGEVIGVKGADCRSRCRAQSSRGSLSYRRQLS